MTLGKRLFLIVAMVWLLGWQGSTRCFAHPGTIASAVAKVQPNGEFEVRLHFDIMSYTLGALPNHGDPAAINALLDGPPAELASQLAEAKERFQQNFHVKNGDMEESAGELTFPSAAEVQESVKGARVRLPVMATVTVGGHLLPGAKTVAFQFDAGLGQVVLTTEFPYHEPISEPVEAGAWSDEQNVPSPEAIAQAAAEIQNPLVKASNSPLPVPPARAVMPHPMPKPKASVTEPTPTPKTLAAPSAPLPVASRSPRAALLPLPTPSPLASPLASPKVRAAEPVAAPTDPPPLPAGEPVRVEPTPFVRWLTHFVQFIKMGYLHILPEGVDHILFVVGLFLLSTRIKPLLTQITAFTVAHSLTLALSLYGIIRLPASIVEPVIAVSIAFVAIENLFTREMKPWRPVLVFGFGLIHGLGFASALQEMGLKQENLLSALLGFNVGVELGQLTVVLAAFLLVGQFQNHPKYRSFVVVPGSIAIAATALFWTFQRIL